MDSHPLSAIILDCSYLLASIPLARIRHDHRETNLCVDTLAKAALRHSLGFISFYVVPYVMSFNFQEDFVGVKYLRLIRIS